MATPIIMPQIGEGVETGVVREWLVQEGAEVRRGDVVAMVEGAKGIFEVEAYESGVLLKILHHVDAEVPVLESIGVIGKPGEANEASQTPVPSNVHIPTTVQSADITVSVPSAGTGEKIPSSPSARRLAQELGVDLAQVRGTGPGGRIVKEDVMAAAKQMTPAAPVNVAEEFRPFNKMRQRIADRMTQCKQQVPHFYLFLDVDVTGTLQRMQQLTVAGGGKISVTVVVIKAVADALRRFPGMNAHVQPDGYTIMPDINIGVAVSVDDGLLAPVLEHADSLNHHEISKRLKELAESARKGIIRGSVPSTFTISNLGMYGITQFIPIINPPECAILGVGSIRQTAVPAGNSFDVRDIMTLSLACDHRLVDGTYAARFFNTIKANIENLQF